MQVTCLVMLLPTLLMYTRDYVIYIPNTWTSTYVIFKKHEYSENVTIIEDYKDI